MSRTAIAGACLLAAGLLGRGGEAQAGGAGEWTFANLMGGYCLEFLAPYEDAQHLLPDDAVPLRANSKGMLLHSALARVVQGQPEFATWVPGRVCVYRFGAANIAGTEIVAKAGDAESIGWVAIGGRVAAGQQDGSMVTTMFFTDGSKAQAASELGQVHMKRVKMTVGPAPRSTERRYTIELGKTRLIWDGHPASDSSAVPEPVVQNWGIRVPGGAALARWQLNAVQQRSMVGAVIVQGKDRLAEAIGKSPIRYVGPLYQGGNAKLSFE